MKNHVTKIVLASACLALLTTGCQTYQQQNKIAACWSRGDLVNAEREASLIAERAAKTKDAVIWLLEQAAVLRAAGKFEESNKAFDQAQEKIDKFAEDAKTSVSQEAGALLSNQAQLPYEGHAYDGIMLNTYKALNYLQLNDFDKARVEMIRAYQRQQDAVEDNKRRIEKAEEEVNKSKDKEAISKAREDDKLKGQLESSYTNFNSVKVYADYVNPFTVYLDGLFFMANSTGSSDLERAHKSFERVSEFTTDNKFVKADLEMVNGMMQGKLLEPTTYVIFETGRAPVRNQIRVDIPILVAKVSYVGAAFPTLKLQDNYASSLNVVANGATETTLPVASMDSVIAQDFKNELPTIITKTMAATITKAIASYAVNQAASQQSDIGGLVSMLGTAIYQAAVNIADLRTWTTLPKEFQVCRIPTPADRKLQLATSSGAQNIPVTIGDGLINIVHVKSINATSPLLVSQIKLK